jgi:hypothetical protein
VASLGNLAGNNPIDALAVPLLRLQPEPELLAHHGSQEGAHRVRLPAVRGSVTLLKHLEKFRPPAIAS